jgi:hypothetical protein
MAAASAGAPANPRGANPAEAELRLESKLEGGIAIAGGLLILRDVDAPAGVPIGARVTATLYYRGGQERTIETILHILTGTGATVTGQPRGSIIGIEVPDDDRARELVRVVVIVARPVTK